MDVQKIKYSHELFKNKIRLEKEIKMVDNELWYQQHDCKHLPVLIGYTTGNMYIKCLLCSKTLSTDYLKFSLDATRYKSNELVGRDQHEILDSRFTMLQERVISYLQENPELTKEQLIEKLTGDKTKNKQLKK